MTTAGPQNPNADRRILARASAGLARISLTGANIGAADATSAYAAWEVDESASNVGDSITVDGDDAHLIHLAPGTYLASPATGFAGDGVTRGRVGSFNREGGILVGIEDLVLPWSAGGAILGPLDPNGELGERHLLLVTTLGIALRIGYTGFGGAWTSRVGLDIVRLG